MKYLFLILLISTSSTMLAQNGKASTIKKTFSRTTTVSIDINSSADRVWELLTTADQFANWNSTVVSLEGKIEVGEKIRLVSTLDPDRTFKLKVKEMTAPNTMVWSDAMGKRTYTIEALAGGVRFTMTERIGSFMFPLFAGKIPSFDESFEQFAADLKKAAES